MNKTKPRLTFWQIWNMSFGFLGIQFGFALQNANVSRIFETLGARVDNIPILWVAAPVTGLIVQPIIGYMSDRTWNRLGRRKPYFLSGAILSSLALILMPNSPVLWVAAGMLWIMDASINISMEPFRAFVGDMLSSEQRTRGFAMQSFFIGTGAVVASLLPYILTNWFNVPTEPAPGKLIPLNVKLSFYLGAIVFFLTVLWTVIRTKEYSPNELLEFDKAEKDSKEDLEHVVAIKETKINFYVPGLIWLGAGIMLSFILTRVKLEKELYIITGGIALFGFLQLIAGLLKTTGKGNNGLNSILADLRNMPATMGQLAVVQFFTWFALFSMWIYTTSAVTSHVYRTSDTTSLAYNEGANWVGVLFGIYNGVAAVFAFLLPVIAKATSRKITHTICLAAGGISLISISLIGNPWLLILPMTGIGLAWASILSMPYAMLTGALPQNKMGVYMGIFNFFIVIPQILAASILGSMVKHLFDGSTMNALVSGGVSMVIAAIMVRFVNDIDDRKRKRKPEPFISQVIHPEWSEKIIIYEVNTRQYTEEGTLAAFADHLPRLKSLGVDVLWFMPTFPIGVEKRKGKLGSYYAVRDYMDVNPEFGTLEDMQVLIDKIHESGMYIILDWVPNHTAWDNPLAEEQPEWYLKDSNGNFVSPKDTDWTDVIQLDWSQEGLHDYMIEAMKFWVNMGVDGFRVDHPHNTPKEFWERAKAELSRIRPVLMLAEHEGPGYFMEKGFDMNYAWELHHLMKRVAKRKNNALAIMKYFEREQAIYPQNVYRLMFLTNHDENSWAGTINSLMGDAHQVFAVLIFTAAGVPLIYSGQETCHDKELKFYAKDNIEWDTYENTPFYRDLIKLKKENTALWNGDSGGSMYILKTNRKKRVFAFYREKDGNRIIVLLNLTAKAVSFKPDLSGLEGDYTEYFSGQVVSLPLSVKHKLDPWRYKIYSQV